MLNKKLDSDIHGQQGSSRRRSVWETEGGIAQGPIEKVGNGILAGIGVGLGLMVVKWAQSQYQTRR